jgi:hypothetical protein
MGQLHFGPARVPSRESPEEAIAILQELGHSACEIDFEGKFCVELVRLVPKASPSQ